MRSHLFGRCDAFEDQHQCPPGRANIDRLVTGVQDENWFLQSTETGHRQEAPMVAARGSAVCMTLRSTRARVSSVTVFAPARFSAAAQALPVAPVVITSSTSRMC